MMILQGLISTIVGICLFLLPAILLAALLRHPPVYRHTQRSRSMRIGLVLGTALLCFGTYYGALAWLGSVVMYSFYFVDIPFGGMPQVTLASAEQFKWGILTELWLHQVLPLRPEYSCFSRNMTICALADRAGEIGPAKFPSFLPLVLGLFSGLVALWLGWRFTRPHKVVPFVLIAFLIWSILVWILPVK